MNDDSSLEQIIHGKDGGLTVDLDTKSDNYIFTAGSRGFVAFIRDQDETVLINQGGTYIQPGTEHEPTESGNVPDWLITSHVT